MKIEKNKIIFAAVVTVILLFLITYSLLLTGDDTDGEQNLKHTLVPNLEDNKKEYNSKLDAINDLKEVHETNAPSIYNDKWIDSLGFYDPDLPQNEKKRIVDSIYKAGRISYSTINYASKLQKDTSRTQIVKKDAEEIRRNRKIETQELGLEHQLFFASNPQEIERTISGHTDLEIPVVVDGTQEVKANSRIRMRLAKGAVINGKKMPKNTPVFGFVSFQPNRVLIEIENIKDTPASLEAFDLQDGSQGIYVENNFRAEATTEVLDDLIGDINIPSVPQVSGITKVLKRRNRNVKVTVLNNYHLVLKPTL